jgi:hypothetical protein
MGAVTAAEMTFPTFCLGSEMSVLMVQVSKDSWSGNPEDAQKTFDLLASRDKELFWIEGTTRRHPEKVLAFFGKHMK